MKIAGLERELPLCPINDELYIGAFVMFGDVEITCAAASELLKKAPEFDVIVTAESKGIPLAYESIFFKSFIGRIIHRHVLWGGSGTISSFILSARSIHVD